MKRLGILSQGALFVENTILPIIFLFFAVLNVADIIALQGKFGQLIAGISNHRFGSTEQLILIILMRSIALLTFNLLCCVNLLVRKRSVEELDFFPEIVVPLLGTFFFLTYNLIEYLPQQWNVFWGGRTGYMSFSVTGLILSFVGLLVSCIALMNLGRSFAVYVEVNPIVSHGIYRYCRHPMYAGYIILTIGLVLLNPNLYFLCCASIAIACNLCRAVFEERKLSLHSAQYRQYRAQTPFL